MAASHNKSGLSQLTICGYDETERKQLKQAFDSTDKVVVEGLSASPCVTFRNSDGRVSFRGVKMAFGYQYVALQKFGAAALAAVPAAKKADDALISHLCGTRNCLVPEHIVIEPKRVNDERTHCHFCMSNIKQTAGVEAMRNALQHGLCPHQPPCGAAQAAAV